MGVMKREESRWYGISLGQGRRSSQTSYRLSLTAGARPSTVCCHGRLGATHRLRWTADAGAFLRARTRRVV